MKTIRIGALTAMLAAGAAIGLAGPANADWTDGTYSWAVIDAPAGLRSVSDTGIWEVTSCGPACKHATTPKGTFTFHLDGNTWSDERVPPGAHTVDNNSLVRTMNFPDGGTTHIQLTKIN